MPRLTDLRSMPPVFWLIIVVKAILICLLVMGAFSGLQQFEGKALLWRLVTYPVGAFAVLIVWAIPAAAFSVPIVWAATGRRMSYPYTVDILLTLPFLIDTVGNTLNLYDAIRWWDDTNHFLNWTLLSGAIGTLARQRQVGPWRTLVYVLGFGATTAIFWEAAEYVAFIRESSEPETAYTDTLGDLVIGVTGSIFAGAAAAFLPSRTKDSTQSTPSGSHYFDADQPIQHLVDDSLGRRSLVKAIARYICTIPAEHGYTVAITGEWGSGKTSLQNMVWDVLNDDSNDIVLLRFNPWLFGGTSDLLTRFFGELSTQLGQKKSGSIKKVALAFTDLGQTLAPLSPIPGTSPVMNLAGSVTGFLARPLGLLEQRERLKGVLNTSNSKIVVFIDDIDRLEPDETREIMRLVRLTCDLPNVVFLLAFDRNQVAKSLEASGTDGQDYIEKIVQVNYDVPAVRETVLPDRLLKTLDALVRDRGIAHFDEYTWGRVFYDIIKPLLGNLRDVKRYINSIPTILDTVGDEVALADLLGMEAIRVLRPDMFEDLKKNAKYLVNPESELIFLVPKRERTLHIQGVLESLLESAGEERDLLKSVLDILFPLTQGYLGGSWHGASHQPLWRRERRLASEEVFRTYLQLTLDDGALPTTEVEEIVNALSDGERLESILDSLDEKRLESALERLEDFEQDFPEDAVDIAVPLLVSQMGRLSQHSNNSALLGISPRFKAHRVIYRLLRRVQNSDDFAEKMTKMFEKINTLSGLQCVIEILGHRENIGHKLVSEAKSGEFEELLIEKVASSTATELENEWNLYALLLRTSNWLEGDARRQLTTTFRLQIDKDEFVLGLLRTAVIPVNSNGNIHMRFHWSELVELFGEGLGDAVERLSRSQLMEELSEEDQSIVSLAQEYASGKRSAEWP